MSSSGDMMALPPEAAEAGGAGKAAKHKGRGGKRNPLKQKKPQIGKKMQRYQRGTNVDTKAIADKKLKGNLKKANHRQRSAAYEAARAEILLPEQAGYLEAEDMERTFKFRQDAIVDHVDAASARKVFNLKLDVLGPYSMRYSHNGRHLLIGGKRGHVGCFDWQTGQLACELYLNETVRDVQWLQNETMFAVAQKRYVYLYDNTGAELQVLEKHVDPTRLEFLRYHFLLASVGNAGYLKYQDVSTSKLVVELRTRLGPCSVMRQNPYNAVMHLGHKNGTVTLWSPNMTTPLVKQLCHRGPVQALAVDAGGRNMVTSGLDGQLKVWDIRNFKDEPVFAYHTPTPPASLDFSQRGLLSVGHGPHIQLWRKPHITRQQAPYLSHLVAGSTVRECRFAPFEDVLGIGHAKGFSSILVPGAGEPNFDSLEANPFQTAKQRQESEVKALLEKIPSDLITLDPNAILRVDRASEEVKAAERKAKELDVAFDPRHRKRGKSSSQRRYLRKQANVIDRRREMIKERLEKEKQERARARAEKKSGPKPKQVLDRFKQAE